MKQNLYIPGDLVAYKDKIFIVKETILDCLGTYFYSDSTKSYSENCIKPIPLTPEILEKNGWKHKEEMYWKNYPYFNLIVDTSSNELSIASVKDSIYLRSVKFVHQLQQVFFGLGLNSDIEV